MFTSHWDPETKKGRARLTILAKVIKTISSREDLMPALAKYPRFRKMTRDAIMGKLEREMDAKTDLGKTWEKIPSRKPNVLMRLFPNQKEHAELAKALATVEKRGDLATRYPTLKEVTSNQIRDICVLLGVKRPVTGMAGRFGSKKPKEKPPVASAPGQPWWEKLTDGQKEEFLTDYRSDYREEGRTNADFCEKWSKITAMPISNESLTRAARAFGETRNRVQIANAYKTETETQKAITTRMKELIHDNALNRIGADALYTQLKQEFESNPATSKYLFAREQFLKMLDAVLWAEGPNGTLTTLIEMMRHSMAAGEKFRQYYPIYTPEIIEEKIQEERGLTNKIQSPDIVTTNTVRGINRFAGEEGFKGGEDFEFPAASASSPFDISVKDPQNWDIMVINALNIGLEHTPIIKENPGVLALAEAEHRKVDAVIASNAIAIDTLKSVGPSKVSRAILSGIGENVDVMDPAYQPIAKRIFANHPDDEVVYTTSDEKLRDLMLGCRKVTYRPEEKAADHKPDNDKTKLIVPMYSGPILIIGGPQEGRLAAAMVYWQIHYYTKLKQNQYVIERKLAQREKTEQEREARKIQAAISRKTRVLEEETNPDIQQELRDGIETLRRELDETVQLASTFRQNADELARLEARTRMSDVHDLEWKRFRTKALAYLTGLLETHIPNSKVLNLGNAYFKAGDTRIKIHVPKSMHVTDTLLADYVDRYGPEVIRGEMADVVAICHPYPLNYRTTAREVDYEGKRQSVAQICVAPACIDDRLIREKLLSATELPHPAATAVFNEQIAPGVLLISCRDGVVTTTPIPLSALAAHQRKPKIIHRTKEPSISEKRIWIGVITDRHVGGRGRERNLGIKRFGAPMSVEEAVYFSLREYGYTRENPPPIHLLTYNDDPTQGQHFDAHRQPDQKQMRFGEIQKVLLALREKGVKATKSSDKNRIIEQVTSNALRQLDVRGTDWHGDQIEDFCDEQIETNEDLFDAVLRRFVNSGIVIRPISEWEKESYEYRAYDRRDFGAINFGTGNHSLKTVESHFAEGRLYARVLYSLLKNSPYWQNKTDLLRRLIRGPIYGNQFISYGTIQAPGGYEWILDLRNTPAAKGTRWSDPLLFAARTKLRRGNISRISERKMSVCIVGDKHFYTAVLTGNELQVMAPPATRTDLFAEIAGGLPPNNTGVAFIGLPAEGPDAGPILLRPLFYQQVRAFIDENPRRFDWEKFLPNPL